MEQSECSKLARKARQAEILHWLEVRKLAPVGKYELRCIDSWATGACPWVDGKRMVLFEKAVIVPGDSAPECVVHLSHATLYALRWAGQLDPALVRGIGGMFYMLERPDENAARQHVLRAIEYERGILSGNRSPEFTAEEAIEAYLKAIGKRARLGSEPTQRSIRFRFVVDMQFEHEYPYRELGSQALHALLREHEIEQALVPAAWLAAIRLRAGGSPWRALRYRRSRPMLSSLDSQFVVQCLQETREAE